jgi:uncharacterized SAM-binding protein YcdF (DUF218 family)
MNLLGTRWWSMLFMPSCLPMLGIAEGAMGRMDAGSREPAVSVEELPVADAIVVLGGAMFATERGDGSVHLYARHESDRFETGLAAKLTMFTADESESIAAILREPGVNRTILCTSVMHLPRAKVHCGAHGLQRTPLPCDLSTKAAAEG